MKWFEFDQNNSGGSFDVDENLCHRLFIQARTAEDATVKAEGLGVYFDGCEKGMDCCGDRWYPLYGKGLEFPHVYSIFRKKNAEAMARKYGVTFKESKKKGFQGETQEVTFPTIESYAQYLADEYGWTKPDCRLFFADGTVKEIFSHIAEKG